MCFLFNYIRSDAQPERGNISVLSEVVTETNLLKTDQSGAFDDLSCKRTCLVDHILPKLPNNGMACIRHSSNLSVTQFIHIYCCHAYLIKDREIRVS